MAIGHALDAHMAILISFIVYIVDKPTPLGDVRAEVREGADEAPRISNAAFAASVSAEINSHKHYPLSARQNSTTGSVGVVFTISRQR